MAQYQRLLNSQNNNNNINNNKNQIEMNKQTSDSHCCSYQNGHSDDDPKHDYSNCQATSPAAKSDPALTNQLLKQMDSKLVLLTRQLKIVGSSVERPDVALNRRHHAHKAKWRHRMAECLESKTATYILIGLLVIDTILVFIELLFLDKVFGEGESVEKFDRIFHYISLTIVSIFGIEIIALLVALGRSFFGNWGYIFDLFIIPISIALEIAFHDVGSFIVILRMWRVIRLAHSSYSIKMEEAHRTHEQLERTVLQILNLFDDLQQSLTSDQPIDKQLLLQRHRQRSQSLTHESNRSLLQKMTTKLNHVINNPQSKGNDNYYQSELNDSSNMDSAAKSPR